MSNVGDYIKQKRKEKNITIQEVCNKTAIRIQSVHLLEAGAFDSLPSFVHAHGFLEQYCKAVGLDFYNEVKPLFDQECQKSTFGKTAEELAIEQEDAAEAGHKSFLQKFIILTIILLLALAGVFIYNINKHKFVTVSAVTAPVFSQNYSIVDAEATAVVNSPSIVISDDNTGKDTETLAVLVPSMPAPPPAAEPAVTPAASAPLRKAVLTFTDECWVKLKSDNGSVEDFIAGRGNEKTVYFSNYFGIDIGNSSAISVKYLDKTFSGFGDYRKPLKNLYFVVDGDGIMTLRNTVPEMLR